MPAIKTGQTFACVVCGADFYRRASYIQRGIRKTCGKPECKSASMRGVGNPFWGRSHSQETLDKIEATKRSRPPQRMGGPPKGYKHTPEARAKITAALKRRWLNNRDKMLACLPRGSDHYIRSLGTEPRHRKQFSPLARREWKATSCAWCAETDDLVLDHIIPVLAGGGNERANAQTLCRKCNLWKMRYVDLPYYLASLSCQGGRD